MNWRILLFFSAGPLLGWTVGWFWMTKFHIWLSFGSLCFIVGTLTGMLVTWVISTVQRLMLTSVEYFFQRFYRKEMEQLAEAYQDRWIETRYQYFVSGRGFARRR
jgi:hypothetical protein